MGDKVSKKITDICFLCGCENPDSRDHTPPKYLFYKKLPDDLLTLQTHQTCQGAYSKDEEYFVTILCTGSWPNRAAWAKYWNDVSPRLKNPSKKKFMRSLLNSMFKMNVKTGSSLYLGQVDAVGVDTDRINRIIGKIIKGLSFSHFGVVISSESIIEIISNIQVEYLNISFVKALKTKSLAFFEKGNYGEFRYFYERCTEKNQIRWILVFYQFYEFLCRVEYSSEIGDSSTC